MAQSIACDLCEAEPAVLMQSNLVNGDTVAVGEACILGFFGGAFATMLEGADVPVIEAQEDALTQLAGRIRGRLRAALPTPSSAELTAERWQDAADEHAEAMASDEVAEALQSAHDDLSEAD